MQESPLGRLLHMAYYDTNKIGSAYKGVEAVENRERVTQMFSFVIRE